MFCIESNKLGLKKKPVYFICNISRPFVHMNKQRGRAV
jgi:hypothetical protein